MKCYKCRRDKSSLEGHHIVPRATGLGIDETVPLCKDCHRYITYRYNNIGGLTEEQHRELFKRYADTGMTPMWDFFAAGVIIAASNFGTEDVEDIRETVELAYDIYLDLYNSDNDGRPMLDTWKILDNISEDIVVEDEILDGFLEHEMREIRWEKRLNND